MAGQKLLVIDDSAFARRILRRILEEGGFGVEEAAGGSEALEKYKTIRPDAVMLDIVMPQTGGLEVLLSLKALDPGAMVIMATADIQEATRKEVLTAGAADIVNKPFRAEDVLAAVSRVLSKRRS